MRASIEISDVETSSGKKQKTLTCALVTELRRTSPARSGSTATLDLVCMAEGLKKGLEGEGKAGREEALRLEKTTKSDDEQNVSSAQRKLFDPLFRNRVFCFSFLRVTSSSRLCFTSHPQAPRRCHLRRARA